jgi:acetyl-CoA carboxylase biotin carboxyl carrier protein
MDLQKIRALIDLLAESPLASLEVIEGDARVKLVKSKRHARRGGARFDDAGAAGRVAVASQRQSPLLDSSAGDVSHVGEATRTESASPPQSATAASHIILAPMFGVVHLTPSPGEAPFVQQCDVVAERQVLCTIEAMKMFNAIESERAGTIVEILVEPGSEVESGQPLFRLG